MPRIADLKLTSPVDVDIKVNLSNSAVRTMEIKMPQYSGTLLGNPTLSSTTVTQSLHLDPMAIKQASVPKQPKYVANLSSTGESVQYPGVRYEVGAPNDEAFPLSKGFVNAVTNIAGHIKDVAVGTWQWGKAAPTYAKAAAFNATGRGSNNNPKLHSFEHDGRVHTIVVGRTHEMDMAAQAGAMVKKGLTALAKNPPGAMTDFLHMTSKAAVDATVDLPKQLGNPNTALEGATAFWEAAGIPVGGSLLVGAQVVQFGRALGRMPMGPDIPLYDRGPALVDLTKQNASDANKAGPQLVVAKGITIDLKPGEWSVVSDSAPAKVVPIHRQNQGGMFSPGTRKAASPEEAGGDGLPKSRGAEAAPSSRGPVIVTQLTLENHPGVVANDIVSKIEAKVDIARQVGPIQVIVDGRRAQLMRGADALEDAPLNLELGKKNLKITHVERGTGDTKGQLILTVQNTSVRSDMSAAALHAGAPVENHTVVKALSINANRAAPGQLARNILGNESVAAWALSSGGNVITVTVEGRLFPTIMNADGDKRVPLAKGLKDSGYVLVDIKKGQTDNQLDITIRRAEGTGDAAPSAQGSSQTELTAHQQRLREAHDSPPLNDGERFSSLRKFFGNAVQLDGAPVPMYQVVSADNVPILAGKVKLGYGGSRALNGRIALQDGSYEVIQNHLPEVLRQVSEQGVSRMVIMVPRGTDGYKEIKSATAGVSSVTRTVDTNAERLGNNLTSRDTVFKSVLAPYVKDGWNVSVTADYSASWGARNSPLFYRIYVDQPKKVEPIRADQEFKPAVTDEQPPIVNNTGADGWMSLMTPASTKKSGPRTVDLKSFFNRSKNPSFSYGVWALKIYTREVGRPQSPIHSSVLDGNNHVHIRVGGFYGRGDSAYLDGRVANSIESTLTNARTEITRSNSVYLYLDPDFSLYQATDAVLKSKRISTQSNRLTASDVPWVQEHFRDWHLLGVERIIDESVRGKPGKEMIVVELAPTQAWQQRVQRLQDEQARERQLFAGYSRSDRSPTGSEILLDNDVKVRFTRSGAIWSRGDTVVEGRRGFDFQHALTTDNRGEPNLRRIANNQQGSDFEVLVANGLGNASDRLIDQLTLIRDIRTQVPGLFKIDAKVPIDKLPEELKPYVAQLQANPAIVSNREWVQAVNKIIADTELGQHLASNEGLGYSVLRYSSKTEDQRYVYIHFVSLDSADRMNQVLQAISARNVPLHQ